MRKLKERLEAMAAAAAFAEAGEGDFANALMNEVRESRQEKRVRSRKRSQERPRPRAYRA